MFPEYYQYQETLPFVGLGHVHWCVTEILSSVISLIWHCFSEMVFRLRWLVHAINIEFVGCKQTIKHEQACRTCGAFEHSIEHFVEILKFVIVKNVLLLFK